MASALLKTMTIWCLQNRAHPYAQDQPGQRGARLRARPYFVVGWFWLGRFGAYANAVIWLLRFYLELRSFSWKG